MIITLGTTPAIGRTMIFDRLQIDGVNRAAEVRVSAAGKGVNATRVIHTLGEPCLCTGFLGGRPGQLLRTLLEHEGISHDFVDVAASTRVCVTVIDRAAGTATELIEEPGAVEEADAQRLIERLTSHAGACGSLLCCGSLARGLPTDFYAQAIRAVRNTSPTARVIVDASGAALAATLGEHVIVKCNRAELAACLARPIEDGKDAPMVAALMELGTRGAAMAVVSAGAAATWICDATNVWTIETPRVKVVSAIGSGDSMAAGLAVGLARGLAFVDAAKLAVACGAANAQTPGPGELDRIEVQRLLGGLSLRKIA